jgi:glycosyltransferase involved in cell wall biosynthesis
VGRDFVAMRPCGLTRYADALMRAQVARGHEVAYLFAGRHYPLLRRPRLRWWRDGGIQMLELLASPNTSHWEAGTREPLADLGDPAAEAALATVLRERRPDVVHVQELAGLASSVLETTHANGTPLVMTLHDYSPLCATVRLLDGAGERCMRSDVGEDCARNCAGAPAGRAHLVDQTVRYELSRLKGAVPLVRDVSFARLDSLVGTVTSGGRAAGDPAARAAPAGHYQQRRDVNVARLNLCDRLVAPSARTAEIYAELGVERSRLAVQRLTLPHLTVLRPRRGPAVGSPLVFVALGAAASYAKGASVLLDAARALERSGRGGDYRLRLLGPVAPAVEREFAELPSVVLGGAYAPADLDDLLDDADVGILPSVWEETHGFVGIELLAKGLPVIANAVGGIPEYVREGETGWLNDSLSGAELAQLMSAAIDRPGEVERLRASVRERWGEIVVPMSAHVDEVDLLYGELMSGSAGARAGR